MTSHVLSIIDPAVLNTLKEVATLIAPILLAWIAYKTATLTKVAKTIEKQTNSMTAALVTETDKASHAKGLKEGLLAGKEEQQLQDARLKASRAEGQLEGQKDAKE